MTLPNATHQERYSLRIARGTARGGGSDDDQRYIGKVVVEINATTVFGVVHAFRTLGMLIGSAGYAAPQPGAGGAGIAVCPSPKISLPTTIEDVPRFAYRGFVVDVAHVYMYESY